MSRFVLVHGACHGAWCWADVAARLQELGHEVHAIDMPGRGGDTRDPASLGLSDHAAAIRAAAGDGAVVVGHSAGGFSISAAAQAAPEAVRHLVYVAALLPQDGQSVVGAMRALTLDGPAPTFARAAGGAAYVFDTSDAGPLLYNDVAMDVAERALARICPEPTAPHREAIRLDATIDALPKTFLRCTADRIIPAGDQTRMADAAGARVIDMPDGHSPFLSSPDALAVHLHDIASLT